MRSEGAADDGLGHDAVAAAGDPEADHEIDLESGDLEVDHGKMTAKLVRVPKLADVPYAVQMEPHLIVEFYSR